jgi:M6 family metalloprotease-like protein
MRARAVWVSYVLSVTALCAVPALAAEAPPEPKAVIVVGSTVRVDFNRRLRQVVPPARAFVVNVNGKPAKVVTQRVGGSTFAVTLERPVYGDDDVVVTYVPLRAGASRLAGAKGGDVSGFSRPGTNRSVAGCTIEPGTANAAMATEGPTGELFAPARGMIAGTILHVNFADQPGRSEYQPLGALVGWTSDLSYGRAALDLRVHEPPLDLPSNRADYSLRSDSPWATARRAFADAVAAADTAVDFSRTQVLFVVFRPGRPAVSRDGMWFARPGEGITADGTEIRFFVAAHREIQEGAMRGLLRALGLPKVSSTFGQWDAMGNSDLGITLSGWHRRKLGWIDPVQTRCFREGTEEVVLSPISLSGGTKLIVVPRSPTIAVVVEARDAVGSDAHLCDRGVLVYRLDAASTSRSALKLYRAHEGKLPTPPGTSCKDPVAPAFDVGEGERSTYEVQDTRIEVLRREAGGWRVRVTVL